MFEIKSFFDRSTFDIVEKLAFSYGQETKLDFVSGFDIGFIVADKSTTHGALALFSYSNTYIVEYLSPLIAPETFFTISLLFKAVRQHIKTSSSKHCYIFRDSVEIHPFKTKFDLVDSSFAKLPFEYQNITKRACNSCNRYNAECFPRVYAFPSDGKS